ncbi:MAG TPA: redoxin domain-containing protein [Gemmatimonadaceae bacterium]|nr:redoxin domain-containing protein [Gemmatimonadaceae bacterium]
MSGSFLNNGELFPAIPADAVAGGAVVVPEYLGGSYGVVLLYRGAWCPYCNAQLAAFARAHDTLAALDVKVVALSADDGATAAATVEKYGIRFLVGHSADVDRIAAATGAYVNEEPRHFHTTGFVLDPDGRVITAVYSSGAIGRLVPDDVAGFIRYVKSHA